MAAEGSHSKPPTPPSSYCVQYEGNGSKRWDGKTISVDSKTLLLSYNPEELIPGKEISIPWKIKSKGIEYWKAIIVQKKPPSAEQPPSTEELSRRGCKRKTCRHCINIFATKFLHYMRACGWICKMVHFYTTYSIH